MDKCGMIISSEHNNTADPGETWEPTQDPCKIAYIVVIFHHYSFM